MKIEVTYEEIHQTGMHNEECRVLIREEIDDVLRCHSNEKAELEIFRLEGVDPKLIRLYAMGEWKRVRVLD